MASFISELQKEILNGNCDIINVLRKAHLIATKLQLKDFDNWIQLELNGYGNNSDAIPDYRIIHGELKAQNPYHGWVPVMIDSDKLTKNICEQKLSISVSEIIKLCDEASLGYVQYSLSSEQSFLLSALSNIKMIVLPHAVFFSVHKLKTIIENIKNCLLEWTIKLEAQGITGEDMSFSDKEKQAAQHVPQTANYYIYGNASVNNASIKDSNLVVGDNATLTFTYEKAKELLSEISDSVDAETKLSKIDKETAGELIQDVNEKVKNKKKPSIIKSALIGLKDFLIGVGASATVSIIQAKMSGMF